MATHSSLLAWRIPGTGEPGGLPSMGSHKSRTRLKRLSSSMSQKAKQSVAEFQWTGGKWFRSKILYLKSLKTYLHWNYFLILER